MSINEAALILSEGCVDYVWSNVVYAREMAGWQ
jgi:hypothetical protein